MAAQKYDASSVYTDYREMLRDPHMDAVSICTWNNTHADFAIAALEAGRKKGQAINVFVAVRSACQSRTKSQINSAVRQRDGNESAAVIVGAGEGVLFFPFRRQ